jgi:hypothetical protein
MDAGGFDQLNELFTDDFVYDLDALGYGRLESANALIDASTALGETIRSATMSPTEL